MDENVILKKVSLVGIFGNVLLAAFKLFAGIIGRSGAMISDAVHSLSDVFATITAYIGVRLAKREEDAGHPYGHERMEYVASLILGLILGVTGIGIGRNGFHQLFFEKGGIETPTLLPLIAAVVSIISKEAMFWYTMYYAKRLDSPAFRADAWHHRTDAISSIGALLGIWLARRGLAIMDPIASLFICVFILKVAFDITEDAINKLIDSSCDDDFEKKVRTLIEKQPGVSHIDVLRTRQFGDKIYVDLEIAVDRNMSLVAAHRIAENVHKEVEARFPDVKHVMVHVNPD